MFPPIDSLSTNSLLAPFIHNLVLSPSPRQVYTRRTGGMAIAVLLLLIVVWLADSSTSLAPIVYPEPPHPPILRNKLSHPYNLMAPLPSIPWARPRSVSSPARFHRP